MDLKKIIIIGLIFLVCLLVIIRIDSPSFGNQFVEGCVTGDLTSIFNDDRDVFFVRVEKAGTLIITQEKISKLMFGAKVKVYAMIGDKEINEEDSFTKHNMIEIKITDEDLEINGYIDFKIQVSLVFGTGIYKLNIIKPGDGRTVNIFNDFAMFNLKVTEANKNNINIFWENLLEGVGSVKVTVMKKESGGVAQQLFQSLYSPGTIFLPQNLVPGDYTVLLNYIGVDNIGWKILPAKDFTVTMESENFLRRENKGGQTDELIIELNGDEDFLWVVWEKILGSKDNPIVSIEMNTFAGESIASHVVIPNNVSVIPLNGVNSPLCSFRIKSHLPVRYSLGLESSKGFKTIGVRKHIVHQTMTAGQKYLYNMVFANSDYQSLDIQIDNTSVKDATITVGVEGTTNKKTVVVKAKKSEIITIALDALADQTYSFYVTSTEDSGKVDFILDYDYTAVNLKISKDALAFNPKQLTYFSGRSEYDWSDVKFITYRDSAKKLVSTGKYKSTNAVLPFATYYDLETVPLIANKTIWDEKGAEQIVQFKLNNVELIPRTGVSQYPTGDISKHVLVSTDGLNKVEIFEKDGMYHMAVKWITDTPQTIGTLKAEEVGIECELAVNPFDVSAYDHEEWDEYIYDLVKKIRKGELEEDRKLKLEIPVQIVQGKVMTESNYISKARRYEPFFDSKYFHMEAGWVSTVRQLKQAISEGKQIGYIERKDGITVYTYLKNNRTKYPIKTNDGGYLWHVAPAQCYESITTNQNIPENKRKEMAEKYIEIYLDYGFYVGDLWYKKLTIDQLTVDQMKQFDATANFETNIWSKIKTVTLPGGEKVTVNDSATAEDYSIAFVDPGTATDKRWDMRWEEPTESILTSDSVSVKKAKETSNAETTARNEKFRKYVQEIATKIKNNEKIKGEDSKKVLKEFLELYIKYQHEKVYAWYETGIASTSQIYNWYGQSNPKQYLSKPFIAQTNLSSSFGPSQIMYFVAWGYGYKDHPTNPKVWEYSLEDYRSNINIGIRHLAVKLDKSVNNSTWIDQWNKALYGYNGAPEYPGRVRNYEKTFLPKAKLER